jgi:hypothetical protein
MLQRPTQQPEMAVHQPTNPPRPFAEPWLIAFAQALFHVRASLQ